MVILRAKEIRELDEKELDKRLGELRLELAKARAQVEIGGAPPNPGRIREIKRTIARALTIKHDSGQKQRPVKSARGGSQ